MRVLKKTDKVRLCTHFLDLWLKTFLIQALCSGIVTLPCTLQMLRHRWMFFLLFGLIVVVLILNFYFAFIINKSNVSTPTEPSKLVSKPQNI